MKRIVRKLMSPSLRHAVSEYSSWLKVQIDRADVRKWEYVKLGNYGEGDVMYMGRHSKRSMAAALLNLKIDEHNLNDKVRANVDVLVSELPLPGSIAIPAMLSSCIPLGRPLEKITENYHGQLRRELHRNKTRYRLQQVLSRDEVEKINAEMLVPYANARHGEDASQIDADEVRRMSLEYGRMDLLLQGDQPVGCQIGYTVERKGKKYWTTNRCGYPASIFSEQKQYRDANAINIFLAMEWANDNGYDFYDIGLSLGRPGDGLLEWKRRRGSNLDILGNSQYFHVKLPAKGAAHFLWHSPLFGVRGGKLGLHLGLPSDKTEEEILSRYREMAYGGLHKIYLYCTVLPEQSLLDGLSGYFSSMSEPPVFETIVVN